MGNGRTVSPGKSTVFVEAGRRGARNRWGPQRIIRLDEFPPDERAAILAAIEAKRAARKAIRDDDEGGQAA